MFNPKSFNSQSFNPQSWSGLRSLIIKHVGGGGGWQIFGKRPWETPLHDELKKELQKAVWSLLASSAAPRIEEVIEPFRHEATENVDWSALMESIDAIKQIIRLAQEFDEEEDELIALLLSL